MLTRRPTTTAALCGLLLLAVGSGCGTTPGAGGPQLLDHDGALAEYMGASVALELPDGTSWDPDPPELRTDPGMMFEVGVGAQTAQFSWYCRWAEAALLADGGSRREALTRLRAFPSLSVWSAMDEVGHTMFTEQLAEAERGDRQALAEYVATNCNSDRESGAHG